MCEMLAFSSDEAIPVERLLRWSALLEQYGLAGYGWGMVWTDGESLYRYRSAAGLRADPKARDVLGEATIRRGFVHSRRPSLMSTVAFVNTQPYMDETWAFAHNGYLENHRELRSRFQTELTGTSDSEVGFCYWREQPGSLAERFQATHETLQGKANFMALGRRGELGVYAGNEDNRVYAFRLGATTLVTTSLHSQDRFLFEGLFPEAKDIRDVTLGTTVMVP